MNYSITIIRLQLVDITVMNYKNELLSAQFLLEDLFGPREGIEAKN